MRNVLLAGMAIFAAFLANADAATLTNHDARPQSFRVVSDSQEQSYTVMPSETVTLIEDCRLNCIVHLENGSEYNVVIGDVLSLEGGELYVERLTQGTASPDRPKSPSQ